MTDSRHALIIANDSYEDRGLKKLKAPGHDADALAEVLHDPQIGDFQVDVIRNEPVQAIRRRIERFFADRRRDDTLLVHFSCHGLKSESGELYFAANDTEPVFLDATAVAAQFVRRCMSRSRAGSTVLFLDCCYGGAFSRGASGIRATGEVDVLDNFAGEKPARGRGWAVITASNSMEYAFEGDELAENSARRPSVFTRAVVQGLQTGEADLDADGEVSLDDLYDYVYAHVREQNPNQTPSKTAQLEGDLHLAHSRRRRIKIDPEPVPASWRTALNSKNHFTRLGVVAELGLRLGDEKLPRAEGARQALEEVARNDIRQVADAACLHLRKICLQPSPVRVDFGRLTRGSPAPHQPVTLGGLPLARACVAHATGAWLGVTESTDGLDVSVDMSAEGHLTGDIVLKGVADDATVHVEAEVETEREAEERKTREEAEHQAREEAERKRREAEEKHRREAEERKAREAEERRHREAEERRHREAEQRRHRDDEEGQRHEDDKEKPREDTAPPPPPPPPPPLHEPKTVVTGAKTPLPPPPPPPKPQLAPTLATATLGLATASAITAILTVIDAVEAVRGRILEGPGGLISWYVQDTGMITPLVVSLVTAVAALFLGFVTRHEVTARQDRYTTSSKELTKALTRTARILAIPSLSLAAIIGVAYLVVRNFW